jgi:2-polyprenyl-6-methoxyphenol hydroxylase-like FAD-dependent oxidoreductase
MSGKLTRSFARIATTRTPGDYRVTLGRAVVLGGGIAGLIAARVLSDHAREVLLLERDDLETDLETDLEAGTGPERVRPGVPQASQVHVLLDGGRAQLDRWFPGFSDELVAAGAVRSSGPAIEMYIDAVRKVPVPDDEIISSSRMLLESRLRRRVLALENVHSVRGRAKSLVFDGDRVSGVWYVPAEAESEQSVPSPTLGADLVVDAMGRSSRLGEWLEQAGWPRPDLRRIGIDLNYATAWFRRGAGPAPSGTTVQALRLPGDDQRASVSVLTAVENERWMMLLSGFADDRPTGDQEDYRRRSRQGLPPVFGEVAENWDLIGPIVTYRQNDSRRRDFHRLRRFPAGLVAVGDAVASFNPVYGQGMSSAALHASCLSAYLRESGTRVRPAWDYFERVRVVIDAAWQTSTINDLALPHVMGPYPRGYAVAHRISDLILRASTTDLGVNRRFIAVTHMRAHPQTLTGPATILRAALVVRAQARANPA